MLSWLFSRKTFFFVCATNVDLIRASAGRLCGRTAVRWSPWILASAESQHAWAHACIRSKHVRVLAFAASMYAHAFAPRESSLRSFTGKIDKVALEIELDLDLVNKVCSLMSSHSSTLISVCWFKFGESSTVESRSNGSKSNRNPPITESVFWSFEWFFP